MKVLMIGPDVKRVPGGMATVVKNCFNSELPNKVNLKYISSNIEGNLFNKLVWNFKALLEYILCLNKYDIVHIHMAERGSFYRKSIYIIISKIFKKKTILHFHGAEFDEFYHSESNKIQKKYIRYILAQTNLIISLGEKWKEKIQNYTETKIVVLSNAVDVPNENFYKIENNNIILLGRLEKRKGTFDLLNIADNIIKNKPQVNIILAGDGDLEKVKYEINKKIYKDNIKLLGWINKDEREELLKNTGIFVLPSYNEGMPMAILEAMSYGIPLVVSNVGDIPSVVNNKKNGYLINAGDKQDLERKILQLLNNNNLRQQISENNYRKIYNSFNLKTNMDKLYKLYEEI